jgi:hypothetical protein
MLIIKADNCFPRIWELIDFCHSHGFDHPSQLVGLKMSVRYKDGKRKRLKRFHLYAYNVHSCEYCGFHVYMHAKVGNVEIDREI